MCFSLSYYKILNVLSTEEVHVWKSDCMVNMNFLLPPFKRYVAWEGRGGGTGAKKKLLCKWTLLPPSWVVLLTILSVLIWLKNKNGKLITIFNFSKPCHRLQHGRKSKIAAQFHFSLYC